MTLLALLLAVLVFFKNRADDREALAASRAEVVELRAQMESQTQLLADLHSKLEQVQQDVGWLTTPATASGQSSPAELNRRISELAEQQAKLLAWFQQQAPHTVESVSPEQRQRLRESGLAVLEARLTELVKAIEDSESRLESLRLGLGVPDELAIMDSDKSADDPQLSAYRYYFEAKRERDKLLMVFRILGTKLAAEKIDQSIPRSP
jgi:chromosome segregation ATPase